MALDVVIGFAVGGAVLYASARRIRACGENVRHRQSLDRFERAMKERVPLPDARLHRG